MSKQVLLLRHGETDWNVQRRFQGGTDIPLNSDGERQAERVRSRIGAWRLDSVWCSPLGRALRTAEIASGRTAGELFIMDDLREISFGRWEGQNVFDLKAHDEIYNQWLEDPFGTQIPGADSTEEILERARRVLRAVCESDFERILIVSHGGTLRAILSAALGVPLKVAWKNFLLSNCSLSGLKCSKGNFVLHFYNDQLHSYCQNDGSGQNPLPICF